MRIAVLWVVLATGVGVFAAMLAATRLHRAHATTFVQPNATEYVWVVIPWLIVAICAAPAIHRVLAAE
jgi:heme/copper-type cytochrome/quinol oxidase subunit 2